MTASLRLRVALAAALAVVLAVGALGVGTQYLVRHELTASQDRALRGRATDVARLSATAPALLTGAGALDAPYGGQDLLVEVLDRRGRLVTRSAALGARLLPAGSAALEAIRSGRPAYGHGDLSGEPLRLFTAPLPQAAGVASGGAVIVAASEREIDRTADRLRTLILLCALGAAGLGAAAAAALTGRGLAPLRRLTAAARDIERTADAGGRLPAAEAGEVGELTRTLNGMLAALEQARRSERRFLADASHELRTPVTALRGNVEYVARHGADPEALADLLADAERLSHLVDALLVLERQAQSPAPGAEVRLDELAREAAAHAPGGDAVTVDAPEPVTVVGDEDALRRALANLVANALLHGRAPVTIGVRAADGRARLWVSDAGPGLPPEHADAAFERFWRRPGSTARPGSGLGLAIVRATARAHGGDVEVAGATFTIDLPAAIVRDPSDGAPSLGDVPFRS